MKHVAIHVEFSPTLRPELVPENLQQCAVFLFVKNKNKTKTGVRREEETLHRGHEVPPGQ
jgi:hypothetical protein